MKYGNYKLIRPFMLIALTILISCIPVPTGQGDHPSPMPSSTPLAESSPSPLPQTSTPAAVISETMQPSQTFTSTTLPSTPQTIVSTPTYTVFLPPTNTKPPRPTRTFTPTASLPVLASTTATETPEPTGTAEPSATICPIATEEAFLVEPVTSPTDQLSQIIRVSIGNGEEVTIVTESGTFTVQGNNYFEVDISLLSNTVHHLEVIAKVRLVTSSYGCVYGGYAMTTTSDRYGAPLTIVQGQPTP